MFLTPEGPSLLGLSHISVNASMTINDTALTNATMSRLEAPDPIDSLDITVCPADDILDGCKVSRRVDSSSVILIKFEVFVSHVFNCLAAVSVRPAGEETGEAAASRERCRRSALQPAQ